MEKNVPKKYMLILQKRYGGQTAVEFFYTGEIRLTPVFSHKDMKMESTTKKDSKVKKNTLAFYDSITTSVKDLDGLLRKIDTNIYPFDYKKETSFLGFMNNGYMNKLTLVFQDPLLREIAINASGNQININNKTTMNIVLDIVDMIESLDSDFFSTLKLEMNKDEQLYHIDANLIDLMQSLRSMVGVKQNREKSGYVSNNALEEDINSTKEEILNKMKSYKTFRELYRFRKMYLYNKNMIEYIEVLKPTLEQETEASCLMFKEQYEEARQKTYKKNKEKINQLEGQMSMFD